MAKMNVRQVRCLFEKQLERVQAWIREFPEFDFCRMIPRPNDLRNPDVLGAKINKSHPPGGKWYDFPPHSRDYRLADTFLQNWVRHAEKCELNVAEKEAMVRLFLLHEFYHIPQDLTSDRYQDSDRAPIALHLIDYIADAYSIVACYGMYTQYNEWSNTTVAEQPWHLRLAFLIRSAVRSMEVFDADDPGYPLESMKRGRFLRYLMWHFQAARALNYTPEGHDLEGFDLTSWPLIEIDETGGFPAERVTKHSSVPDRLKLFITWKGRIYRHTGDSADFARGLLEGVLRADCNRSNESFRELLPAHPVFTGRAPASTTTYPDVGEKSPGYEGLTRAKFDLSGDWQGMSVYMPVDIYNVGSECVYKFSAQLRQFGGRISFTETISEFYDIDMNKIDIHPARIIEGSGQVLGDKDIIIQFNEKSSLTCGTMYLAVNTWGNELQGIIAVRNPYFGTPASVKIILRRVGQKEVTADDLGVSRFKVMADAFLKFQATNAAAP